MTKILVWGTFIFLVAISIDFQDRFAKECNEAGGFPTLTLTDLVCLHPSSIIELKRGKRND